MIGIALFAGITGLAEIILYLRIFQEHKDRMYGSPSGKDAWQRLAPPGRVNQKTVGSSGTLIPCSPDTCGDVIREPSL